MSAATRPSPRPWAVLPGQTRAYAELLGFLALALESPPSSGCSPWMTDEDWYAYLVHQILGCTDAWRPRAAA
jgi:hypothetical protein